MNKHFVSLIEESDIFALVTPPSFALSVFRLVFPGSKGKEATEESEASLDALNRAFHKALSARTDIFLTQTILNGTFCLRLAVGSQRTEEADIKWAFNVAQEVGRAVLKAQGAGA